MTTSQRAPDVPLEVAIKDAILRRTGGRIHMLEVDISHGYVFVRGMVASHYLRQMGQQGIFDVMGVTGTAVVEVDIQVSTAIDGAVNSSGRASAEIRADRAGSEENTD